MSKIHTRTKRKFGLSRRKCHYNFFHPGVKKNRPKTFKTEESARAWASANGIAQFTLKKAKHNKRFQVVPTESLSK